MRSAQINVDLPLRRDLRTEIASPVVDPNTTRCVRKPGAPRNGSPMQR